MTTRSSSPRRPGAARQRGSRPNYTARRLVVLGVALALIALLWWAGQLLAGLVRDSFAQQQAVAAAEAAASASATAQPEPCAVGALEVSLDAGDTRVGAGLDFGLTITNTGEDACLVDAGATSLVVTVTSGADTVWSTAHCGSAEPNPLLLGPGDATTRTVPWGGQRSAPGCGAVAGNAQAGTYSVATWLADKEVPGAEAVFRVR